MLKIHKHLKLTLVIAFFPFFAITYIIGVGLAMVELFKEGHRGWLRDLKLTDEDIEKS